MFKKLFFFYLLFYPIAIFANNLQIRDVTASKEGFTFKISWQYSWNYSDTLTENHDACWIFIKIKEKGFKWHTLKIENENINSENNIFNIHSPTNSSGFMLSPQKNGDFIQIFDKIRIQTFLPKSDYKLKIFGIEMVSVPQSSYYLGDGVSFHHLYTTNDTLAAKINSEDAIQLYAKDDSILKQELPSSYPKGFDGFYAMKYEISQQQYTDFLNCLDFLQQMNHTRKSPDNTHGTLAFAPDFLSRNGIVISVSGQNRGTSAIYECNANGNNLYSEAYDAETRAMNWLNWSDLAAYLDWAGLRPLSELEFEKLARGTNLPVKGEFAWGTPYAKDANSELNSGTELESVVETGNDSTGLANYGYEGLTGPLRCGFAASSSSNRTKSGSGFYGAKELSGNLWEILVSASYSGFSALNGDGELDEFGFANVASWCPQDAGGTIYRGGAWSSGIYEVGSWRDLAISDRYYFYLKADIRRNSVGGRGGISF